MKRFFYSECGFDVVQRHFFFWKLLIKFNFNQMFGIFIKTLPRITCRNFELFSRLASLVGITERETGVGKLGWHGSSTGFDRFFFFPILLNERKKKD